MKKLLFILLLTIPFIGFGQLTTGFYENFGYFYKTTDGGQTWTQQNNNNQQTTGIDHISFIKNNITSTLNIPTPSSNRKLEKVIDILGRKTKPHQNTPFIEIYDDGSTEKKIVVD